MLNSRQLAMVLWLAIFVVWALTLDSVRSSIGPPLKQLLSPRLLVPFTTIVAYNVAAVWWLGRIGYWDSTMLYDTVTVVAVGAIGSVFRAATRGVTYDLRFFLRTVLVNLEVMVLLAFLYDLFPFNFWIEFLVVVPGITVLVMLVTVSARQEGAEQVHRLLSRAQAFVGLALIAYVLWQAVMNYEQLLNTQALFAFGLPFVMSVMFIPGLYFVCTAFAYEAAFRVVLFKNRNDKHLARWKKRRLFLHFGLNLKALQAFTRARTIHEFSSLKTKEEALAFLASWRAA